MNDSKYQDAVGLLQQLGLKEYEAKCYVSLTRFRKATAKEISESSDVPRTRVYDAIRVLEKMGLVEVQHTNPKQFRAVPPEEAAATLRTEYESRTDALVEAITQINPASTTPDPEVTHEVWSLSGIDPITNRTSELIGDAHDEIVLIVGRDEVVSDSLLEQLREVQQEGVDVIVGAVSDELRDRIQRSLPGVSTFTSELEWLRNTVDGSRDEVMISRLLLVDGNTILVSTLHVPSAEDVPTEQAVFGRGFTNGLVVVARRLMATGLPQSSDPGN